jgi:hypothetical protein
LSSFYNARQQLSLPPGEEAIFCDGSKLLWYLAATKKPDEASRQTVTLPEMLAQLQYYGRYHRLRRKFPALCRNTK